MDTALFLGFAAAHLVLLLSIIATKGFQDRHDRSVTTRPQAA